MHSTQFTRMYIPNRSSFLVLWHIPFYLCLYSPDTEEYPTFLRRLCEVPLLSYARLFFSVNVISAFRVREVQWLSEHTHTHTQPFETKWPEAIRLFQKREALAKNSYQKIKENLFHSSTQIFFCYFANLYFARI